MDKNKLEKLFYKSIPKARKINPFFREYFELVYDAKSSLGIGARLLNIYSSADLSSKREDCFRDVFFVNTEYYSIDFWADQFIENGKIVSQNPGDERYHLHFQDNFFDAVFSTKVIMEHVSKPQIVVDELYRVLKPGGIAFVVAPHIRRQHQPPHDYFRFSQYALDMLFHKSGFSTVTIKNTGGFMAVVGYYSYFFQRGLGVSKFIEKILDWMHYWIIEPICYSLDRLDNGYGRDMTLYFLVKAIK